METKWNNQEWIPVTGETDESLEGKIVYLAGPMRGIEKLNRPVFYSAEDFLWQEGALVLNPARLPVGMPQNAYMPICLAMLEQADMIVALPGWEFSGGAKTEVAYAKTQGKFFMELAYK